MSPRFACHDHFCAPKNHSKLDSHVEGKRNQSLGHAVVGVKYPVSDYLALRGEEMVGMFGGGERCEGWTKRSGAGITSSGCSSFRAQRIAGGGDNQKEEHEKRCLYGVVQQSPT